MVLIVTTIAVVVLACLSSLLFPIDHLSTNYVSKVAGKNVIVTGSSMGIGRSLALEYASKGANNVVIVSRSTAKLNDLKNEINQKFKSTKVHVLPADLSSQENCEAMIKKSIELMGTIDYLVLNHITDSNYGMWLKDSTGHYDDRSFLLNIFQVNTFSYIWAATAASESLIKTNGQIVVVSSLAGHVGTPFTAAYSSSKHALHGFFNPLRNEFRIMGGNTVGVTICAIGATDTEGASGAKAQLTKIAWDPPEEAAVAIVRGGATKKRDIYHPHHKVFPVVLINKFWPSLVDYILRSTM